MAHPSSTRRGSEPNAIDARLHAERIGSSDRRFGRDTRRNGGTSRRSRRCQTVRSSWSRTAPPSWFSEIGCGDGCRPGYIAATSRPRGTAIVITPPSLVSVLAAGWNGCRAADASVSDHSRGGLSDTASQERFEGRSRGHQSSYGFIRAECGRRGVEPSWHMAAPGSRARCVCPSSPHPHGRAAGAERWACGLPCPQAAGRGRDCASRS